MAQRYRHERVASKGKFAKGSFRTVTQDGHLITVGCPKGKFSGGRCRVGTKAQRILHPLKERNCPIKMNPKKRQPRNPEPDEVIIYPQVDYLGATKADDSDYPGPREHGFEEGSKLRKPMLIGLANGDLLVTRASDNPRLRRLATKARRR